MGSSALHKGSSHSTVTVDRRRGRHGDGVVCLLVCFVVKRAGQCHTSTGASWLDTELSGVEKGREVSLSGPGGWTVDLARCPRCLRVWLCPGRAAALSSRWGRGVAKHLQALLSSTLTGPGLIAPVRFIWEAAEGASCSFTLPRLGFSSTPCLACKSAVTPRSLRKEHSVYCRQSGSPSSPSERTLCWCQGPKAGSQVEGFFGGPDREALPLGQLDGLRQNQGLLPRAVPWQGELGARQRHRQLWELGVQQLGGAQASSLTQLALVHQSLVSTHGLVGGAGLGLHHL